MCNSQNPFCADRLRPGQIPFVFAHGQSLEQLLEQLEQSQWCGAIVGLHGTGKSTLLAELLRGIERTGRSTPLVTLHDGEGRLPSEFRTTLRRLRAANEPFSPVACDGGTAVASDWAKRPLVCRIVVAVDGYEQLRPWNRWLLRSFCRRRGCGLIVASHRPTGLPELYRTAIDVPLAWRVVEKLQEGLPSLVRLADVVERLARNHGNLRESLFDLYDLYEARRHL